MRRNTCYKWEKRTEKGKRWYEQHIHRDATSFNVDRKFRYFLKVCHLTWQADPRHKVLGDYGDIEYSRKYKWYFQYLQFKTDLKRALGQMLLPRLAYPVALVLMSWIHPEKMWFLFSLAIAADVSDQSQVAGSVTSITFNHTNTGSNLALLGTTSNGGTSSAHTYTYNAVSFTSVQEQSAGGNRQAVGILQAPASGLNSFVAGWTTATSTNMAVATSYTGCAQTGQPDASAQENNASATSIVVNITTVAANCWGVAIIVEDAGEAITAGARTVNIQNWNAAGQHACDSGGVLPTGATDMNASWTTSAANRAAIMSFSPATAAATNKFFSLFP